MERRVAHAVDDARRGRLAASRPHESSAARLGKQRVFGHRKRHRGLRYRRAHAILDPAVAVRRRQERGVGERPPHETAERIAETADHGIPRAGGRRRRRRIEPAVPGKIAQLDGARKNRRGQTFERVVTHVLYPLRIVRAIALAPHGIAEHDALAAALQKLDEAALKVDAFFEAAKITAHEAPRRILDARARGVFAHRGCEQKISVKPALSHPRRPGPAVVT